MRCFNCRCNINISDNYIKTKGSQLCTKCFMDMALKKYDYTLEKNTVANKERYEKTCQVCGTQSAGSYVEGFDGYFCKKCNSIVHERDFRL